MPAPDLPPPPEFVVTERPLQVHLHVNLVSPDALVGATVVVIDALRASATIAAALASGATRVVPALTVDDALASGTRWRAMGERVVLGGERGGVLIPGFDLDNSPRRYTPERVAGATVVFTTTNGTAALLHARGGARVLVGAFPNLGAVAEAVANDPRPVHIVCCGTRSEISLDDVLPAGAFVERLVEAGRQLVAEDSGRVALMAWRGALASPGGLNEAMRASRGGRNLARQGLAADVDECAAIDVLRVVPRFVPGAGPDAGVIVREDGGAGEASTA
ncbi:MAG: 2-phosphosulfolactate phosphatase [Planctomycetota bacterium]|nr:2-phosphosulfolactate phosphatase [Planctomycetota bacterium]